MKMIKTKIFKIISPFWKKLLLASVLSGTSLFMAVGLLMKIIEVIVLAGIITAFVLPLFFSSGES
jgi:hypothetical protein